MGYDTTNLHKFTEDYIARTMANYEFVKKESKKRGESNKVKYDVYEVTQLINSLFGVLIMPLESIKAINKGKFGKSIAQKANKDMRQANSRAFEQVSKIISELKNNGKIFNSYIDDYEEGVEEAYFIYRLRNSLAHSGNEGLRFYPIRIEGEKSGPIESVIFCNIDPNVKDHEFIAELSVEQIEILLNSLIDIFSNYSPFGDTQIFYYEKDIRKMREKMKYVYSAVFEYETKHDREVTKRFGSNLEKVEKKGGLKKVSTVIFNESCEENFLAWIIMSEGKYRVLEPEDLRMKLEKMASQIRY